MDRALSARDPALDHPEDGEPRDAKAERRAARKAREAGGMQVTNRGLKSVQQALDAQRRRNARRGFGPLTDDEVRRLGRDREP